MAAMVALLVVSASGLIYTFFGGEKPVSIIPKTLSVEIDCGIDSYLSSYVLNADRENGYLAIILIPVTKSARGIDCKQVEIYSDEIDLTNAYASDWNDFTAKRPTQSSTHNFEIASKVSFTLDTDKLNKLRAFSFVIPTNDLVEYTDAGVWTSALNVSTTYVNGQPPEVISENEFSMFVDPNLVIAEMSPAFSRGRGSEWAEKGSFSTLLDKSVKHPLIIKDGTLQFVEDKNIQNVITGLRFFLKLRDPNHSSTRDIMLLVFSTLFGIAIGGLIEAFLALSLQRHASLPNKNQDLKDNQ